MRNLYDYYFYKMWMFYRRRVIGPEYESDSSAYGTMVIFEMINIMSVMNYLEKNLKITILSDALYVFILIVLMGSHVLVYGISTRYRERLERRFSNTSKQKNRTANFLIIAYVIATFVCLYFSGRHIHVHQ